MKRIVVIHIEWAEARVVAASIRAITNSSTERLSDSLLQRQHETELANDWHVGFFHVGFVAVVVEQTCGREVGGEERRRVRTFDAYFGHFLN